MFYKSYKPKPFIKKICKICGYSFETRRTYQKCCSPNCTKINHEKYNKEYQKKFKAQLPEKICEICSSKYQPKNHRQRFCKPECSLIYQRAIYFNNKDSNRWEIFNRDNFTCQYCGRNPTENKVKLHLDHIKPKIDGGTDDLENLVTACTQCNLGKSTKSLRNEVAFKKRFSKKLL